MGPRPHRNRDKTFLRLAAFAAAGGVVAIGVSTASAVITWHAGRPGSTFFFFSLWGFIALAGAAANVVVYFQSGDPPGKPPRGGRKVVALRSLDARAAPQPGESERKAA
jgi:hypothetical protein